MKIILYNSTFFEEITSLKFVIENISKFQIALLASYGTVCLLGVLGNISVIFMIIRILRFAHQSQPKHLFIYILCLSITDLLVLSTLPLMMSDLLLTTWLFGVWICRYYMTMESVTKVLSIFLLTSLSVDRYIAVKRPFYLRGTKRSVIAGFSILSCIVAASLVLVPLPVFARVEHEVEYHTHVIYDDRFYYANFTMSKCIFDAADGVQKVFASYTFVLCYCLPAFILIVFYSKMLRHLSAHVNRHRSVISIRRIMSTIVALILIHFICWTPYWMITLVHVSKSYDLFIHDSYLYASYIIHAFPYVNSVLNPILYAFMNKELKNSYNSATLRRKLRLSRINAENTTLRPPSSAINGFSTSFV